MPPESGDRKSIKDPSFVSVGVTGGIASGKSTVVKIFAALGATTIDADAIAREVVVPGSPILEAIRQRFGASMVRPDGTLDRAALAARVFASAEERHALNAITHPAIVAEIKQRLARERELANQAARPGAERRVAVAEIPLLIEEGLQSLVDRIIVVFAKQTTQVARLLHGKGLTEEQAWARVRAQLPLEEKLPFADWVIDGEAPLPEVERCVRRIWAALRRRPRPAPCTG